MPTESFNKKFKLTTEEQIERFYKILENHMSNGENPYDFLKEWINSYISGLESIKTEIILQKICQNNNKEKIIEEIKKVFEIMDCFEKQRKIYEKYKINNIK